MPLGSMPMPRQSRASRAGGVTPLCNAIGSTATSAGAVLPECGAAGQKRKLRVRPPRRISRKEGGQRVCTGQAPAFAAHMIWTK